jgi:hypothetical protein
VRSVLRIKSSSIEVGDVIRAHIAAENTGEANRALNMRSARVWPCLMPQS